MNRADLNMGFNQFSEPHQEALKRILNKNEKVFPKILEIGCWIGESTNVICNFIKESKGGHLYVVDTFEGSPETALVEKAKSMDVEKIFINNMKALGNDSLITHYRGKSQELSHNFEDESLDVIFIDGDHRYDYVKKDIELYFPKLKFGGIICGHDYDHPEFDEQFIHQDFVNNKHHGVIKAVNEKICKNCLNQDFVFWWARK